MKIYNIENNKVNSITNTVSNVVKCDLFCCSTIYSYQQSEKRT